jgi:hypothetical protein
MKYEVFTHTIENSKTKVHNAIITLILLAFGISASAQHLKPPKTYWQSFGYQKQPDHIKRAYYKSDSLGYEPTKAEVISFNKEGFIIQEYEQTMGKFAKEKARNYVYKNGVLDSINTLNTDPNYNTWQKLHYDEKGKLVKMTINGKYSNFTDTFTYYDGGMVKTIFRLNHASGTKTVAEFVHNRNYIKETLVEKSGRTIESCYIYDGDNLFASFTIRKNQSIQFYDEARRITYELENFEGNPFEYALKQRTAYQKNENALAVEFDKSDARIIIDIPAETTNEQGDWIRRLQLDKRYSSTERRLVFNQIMYADGTKSGSTEMDLIFESKVRKMK